MSKQEFLDKLRMGLTGLPQDDIEERLNFYGEMIDDRMEEGLTEEQAVCEIGIVDEVVAQIVAETPLSKLVKEKVKPKRSLGAWEIVLIIIGSPIWLSLLIAAFAVVLSIYVVLWTVIISLWAIEASLAACALGGLAAAVVFLFCNNVPQGICMLGASLVCAGLSIFLVFGCKAATRGILLLTKKLAFGIKRCFVGKGKV